jgi:hypothetical protein
MLLNHRKKPDCLFFFRVSIHHSLFDQFLLFEIGRREVSMMSTLAVKAGFASHRRHKFADFTE